MENLISYDNIEIKEINNLKALYFKVDYPKKKIYDEPIFKTWLEIQKRERGHNGFICYCRKCYLFFYFMNENEKIETKKKCCDDYSFGKICNYCKEIYFECSYCCTKRSIIESLKLNLFNGKYNCKGDIYYTIKILPFLFFIYLFFSIFLCFYFGRREKVNKEIFSSVFDRENCYMGVTLILSLILIFIYSIIFMVPYTIIYILYLLFILIQNIKNKI